MAGKLNWFKFYPDRFLGGTEHMDNDAVGAYIRLLCQQWIKDSLPNNKDVLIKYCHGDSSGLEVALKKFKKQKNGTLKNTRLETEKKNAKKSQKILSKNGEEGAKKRWHKKLTNNELHSVANGEAISGANGEAYADHQRSDNKINTDINTDRSDQAKNNGIFSGHFSTDDLKMMIRNFSKELNEKEEKEIIESVNKASEKNKIGNPQGYVNTVVQNFLEKKFARRNEKIKRASAKNGEPDRDQP